MIQPHFHNTEDILIHEQTPKKPPIFDLHNIIAQRNNKQTVDSGTASTRKEPSAGQIEKAEAVSTPSKQPINDEEIHIMCVPCSIAESMLSHNSRVMGRSGAGKSSVCKRELKIARPDPLTTGISS